MWQKLNRMSSFVSTRVTRRLGPMAKDCTVRIVTIVCVILLFSDVAAAESIYGIGDVFVEGGSNTWHSEANAVSANGTTVVGMSYWNNYKQAVYWTKEQGLRTMGEWWSEGIDVSADGSIFVYNRGNGRASDGWPQSVYLYSPGQYNTFLGRYGGIKSTQPTAISADGTVVVGEVDSNQGNTGFLWTAATGMVGCGDSWDYPSDVSGDGSVIVGGGNGAWMWTQPQGLQQLGDLTSNTSYDSYARAVSMDGTSIVGQANGEAFRWTEDEMVGLGFLPGGTSSEALGVSADGSVIVGTANVPVADSS